MNHPRNVSIVLLLAAFASVASAQEEKTRAQVEAETAAAMRNGDMLSAGEIGLTQRELHPNLYPSAPVVGKTRAQVKAELAAAQRNGDMLAAGESGLRQKDLDPGMYPADPVVAGKTRAQVVAETREAQRLGLLSGAGERGPKQATPQQERQIELAGLRATGQATAAVK